MTEQCVLIIDDEPDIRELLEIESGYAVYLARQESDISAIQKDEMRPIPEDFDYGLLSGLSNELRHKLEKVRPANIGQASRMEGMTPAALTLLLAYTAKIYKQNLPEQREAQ